jgi:uncharacterized protein YciI
MYYLLLYDVVENYVEKRKPLRDAHLDAVDAARKAFDRGELVLGGAFADPVDGAALVFKGDDPSVAERFARNDPYVVNGLVRNWRVRAWNVVVGGERP